MPPSTDEDKTFYDDDDMFESDSAKTSSKPRRVENEDPDDFDDSCFENSVTLVGRLYYSGELKVKETSRGYVAAFQLHIDKAKQNKVKTHKIYIKAYRESTIQAIEDMKPNTMVKIFGYVESSGNNTCINAKSVIPWSPPKERAKTGTSGEPSEKDSEILAKIEERLAKVVEQGERIVKSKGGVVFDKIEDEGEDSVTSAEALSLLAETDDEQIVPKRPAPRPFKEMENIDEELSSVIEDDMRSARRRIEEDDPFQETTRFGMQEKHRESQEKIERIRSRISEIEEDKRGRFRNAEDEDEASKSNGRPSFDRERTVRREADDYPASAKHPEKESVREQPKERKEKEEQPESEGQPKKKFLSGWNPTKTYESEW